MSLPLAASANAAMYKWTDQNGNVQYGQFPPTGVAAERISASGTTHKVEAPDGKSPQQRLQALEQQQQQQEEEETEARVTQERKDLRQQNCKIAHKNLAVLKEDGHHRVRLPDGTVTYLNDEQKQLAEASKERLGKSGRFDSPIVTEIVAATRFYPAEDYHQDYYKESPVRYKFYRYNSGRDQFINRVWGKDEN